MDIPDRIKSLRDALGMTQEELGVRAYPDVPPAQQRPRISKIETGHNQLGSIKAREALARGFGMRADDLDAYLAGAITTEEAVRRIRNPAPMTEGPPKARVGDHPDWARAYAEALAQKPRRLPPGAWALAASTSGRGVPEHLTADWVYNLAAFWFQNATDDQLSGADTAIAQAEMDAEDAEAAPANDAPKRKGRPKT